MQLMSMHTPFRGAIKTIVAAVASVIGKASSLMHFEGPNGGGNATFLDSSVLANTLTPVGTGVSQGSFSPYQPFGWGVDFSSSALDELRIANTTQLDIPASTPFTIELWMNPAVHVTNAGFLTPLAYSADSRWYFSYYGATGIGFSLGSGWIAYTSSRPPLNKWTHVVVTRDSSNNFRIFYDGVAQTLQTGTTVSNHSGAFVSLDRCIGNRKDIANANFGGRLSNMHVVIGTALYTANFTPPISEPIAVAGTRLLCCQSNRFKDSSVNALGILVNGTPKVVAGSPFSSVTPYDPALHGGSLSLTGAGGVTCADSVMSELLGGNFTIDAWVYPTAFTADAEANQIVTKVPAGASFAAFMLFANSSGVPRLFITSAGSSWDVALMTGSKAMTPYAWNHLAVTRQGTAIKLWLNGVVIGTATSAAAVWDTGTGWSVGSRANGTGGLIGYVTDARIMPGNLMYSAPFTPPVAPLEAIGNTALLVRGANAAMADSTCSENWTVSGAVLSSAKSRFGLTSVLFNGVSSYIRRKMETIGTKDFTVECWVNPTSFAGSQYGRGIFSLNNSAVNETLIVRTLTGTATLNIYYNVASTVPLGNSGATTSVSLAVDTWAHLALVRKGNVLTLYANGAVAYAWTEGSTRNFNLTTILVGVSAVNDVPSGSNASWNGHIDEFKYTPSAVYDGAFTPPDAQF